MANAKSSPKEASRADSLRAGVSAKERERMIAEAAYYRALERGFAAADPLDDWLAAEREIDRALSRAQPQESASLLHEPIDRRGAKRIRKK